MGEGDAASGRVDGVTRVEAVLRQAGMHGRVRRLEASARTAADAAAALDCPVGAIASSLVFEGDGQPVLVVASGAHRVDTERVAALVGARAVRRASLELVRRATGFAAGGVAPVGHPAPLRTVLDATLASHERLWASAGHPHAVFFATFDELRTLTGAPVADVAVTQDPDPD